jgi:hypothetical protein
VLRTTTTSLTMHSRGPRTRTPCTPCPHSLSPSPPHSTPSSRLGVIPSRHLTTQCSDRTLIHPSRAVRRACNEANVEATHALAVTSICGCKRGADRPAERMCARRVEACSRMSHLPARRSHMLTTCLNGALLFQIGGLRCFFAACRSHRRSATSPQPQGTWRRGIHVGEGARARDVTSVHASPLHASALFGLTSSTRYIRPAAAHTWRTFAEDRPWPPVAGVAEMGKRLCLSPCSLTHAP